MNSILVNIGSSNIPIEMLAEVTKKNVFLGILAVQYFGVDGAFDEIKKLRNKTKKQIIDHFYKLEKNLNQAN